MADDPTLPADVLRHIAGQIGERLTTSGQDAVAAGVALALGESFPVWRLGLDRTVADDGGPDLSKSAVPTGYWHHQIRHDARAVEFARSRPLGPRASDWRVEELATSRIASSIEKAIGFLDARQPTAKNVRLLVIPAYLMHVFWFVADDVDQVLLIDMPVNSTPLRYNRIYSGQDFLRLLSSARHVTGVPAP